MFELHVRRCAVRLWLFVVGCMLTLCGALLLFSVSRLQFVKSAVWNVEDVGFFAAENPPGFIEQNARSPRLRSFRSQFPTGLQSARPSLQTAIQLCHWVHRQQPDGASWVPHKIRLAERLRGDLEDPFLVLKAQREGAPAVCRRFAYLFVGAAESAGMRARVVIVSRTFWKSYVDGHVMTEIWVPQSRKWVLMDAMWDLLYTVDGVPASATEVYNVVHSGRVGRIGVNRNGTPANILDRALVAREFAHLYIAMTNGLFDGYRVCAACDKQISFAHLTSKYSPPYPVYAKRLGLCCGCIAVFIGVSFMVRSVRFSRRLPCRASGSERTSTEQPERPFEPSLIFRT